MSTPHTFIFKSYYLDKDQGCLSLRYAFDDTETFEETIHLPPLTEGTPPFYRQQGEAGQQAMDNACRLLFLLAGVSYYKARIPKDLRCDAFPLSPRIAAFIERTYRNGLGEFAWQNQIDLRDKIHVIADKTAPDASTAVSLSALPPRTCVPVGGGKDSIVTLETLRQAKEDIILFRVGTALPIEQCIERSKLPSLQTLRKIDPHLIKLNQHGAYNGHIPVTAIVSAIAVVTALWSGYNAIAFSHEHSASAPNLTYLGEPVNHQYSKSLDFERDFADILAHTVTPDLAYYSFLRPLTEAAIARCFARYNQYFPIFKSCNKSFKIDESKRLTHWCCNCPKCDFVFLALAPFVEKQTLIATFGQNLLSKTDKQEAFAALCGLSSHKPFECVGTIEESALLMAHLSTLPDWKNDAVVKALAPQIPYTPTAFASLFALRPDHTMPPSIHAILAQTIDQALSTSGQNTNHAHL